MNFKDMSSEELIEVVQAMDRIEGSLDKRFEGDDDKIVELMTKNNLPQDIVSKLLITGAILRECANRGLHIPRGNQ